MNYAPTVHYPYADISGVVKLWADKCVSMVVYEHGPDVAQKSIHCHFYIEGCEYSTAEGLKRIFHSNFKTDKKANELWAWTHKEYPVIYQLSDQGTKQYLKYMSKGELAPKYVKNISPDLLDEAKAMWVSPNPVTISPEAKSEFDSILKYLINLYDNKDLSGPQQFKNDICYFYLKKRKPVPRMGDLTRYSYSAYMIMVSDRAQEHKKDDVLKSAVTDFILSYESGNIK